MAGIMSRAVAQLKDHVQCFLGVAFVGRLARELGLCWRETTLALPNLVAWFARQILGDIVIADRAFESFAHAALLLERGLHMILPIHQKRKVRRAAESSPRLGEWIIRRARRRAERPGL